ncbi:hypothetical protein BRADI_1g58881v3 [Brachypodium distachyon]|uniref:Endonuclease/exonuclease/phosphatase domain-containing protein n=1 Tax=Brachypodium distachyon TaxID=15368 RepID=A0A2K2DSC8_BRADI|nr:hypothetical protein BRADI_1g58881v3 [Brachypodium distachyon]
MKTLCWKCRGIGDPATARELRDLVKECMPSVLCLVETQLSKQRVEGLASTLDFDSAFAVASSGGSGGLCMYWKSSLNLQIKTFSKYHIDSIIMEDGKDPWRLTCFYGEATRTLRHLSWQMLCFLRGESTLPWMCLGDFNEVLCREEHLGINEREGWQMDNFREAIDICGLCDIGIRDWFGPLRNVWLAGVTVGSGWTGR